MLKKQNFSHENFDRPDKIKMGSERSFGLTFAGLFLLLALYPLFTNQAFKYGPLTISFILTLLALIIPTVLKWPNYLWLKLGLLLNKLVSPIILIVLFFVVFTPMAYLLRIFGKDILKLKLDPTKTTYWIESDTSMTSMKNQF